MKDEMKEVSIDYFEFRFRNPWDPIFARVSILHFSFLKGKIWPFPAEHFFRGVRSGTYGQTFHPEYWGSTS